MIEITQESVLALVQLIFANDRIWITLIKPENDTKVVRWSKAQCCNSSLSAKPTALVDNAIVKTQKIHQNLRGVCILQMC